MAMTIIRIKEHPEMRDPAAFWFHEKWKIPLETYRASMDESIAGKDAVPQWYLAISDEKIIGGAGVIENDFHNRKDLTPNVCALYVEEENRRQGTAGAILNHICLDMKRQDIDTLYLVTDHQSFYERYGWRFLCMVENTGDAGQSRMYVRQSI